jgi:quercetin dioxygenase-like cupin family protein
VTGDPAGPPHPASGSHHDGPDVAVWGDWRQIIAVADPGTVLTVLHESAQLKVVLVSLPAGRELPSHAGAAASFHILDGTGVVVLDGVEHSVRAGVTVIAKPGAQRGVRAGGQSPLVFLGNLSDPASEDDTAPDIERAEPVPAQ